MRCVVIILYHYYHVCMYFQQINIFSYILYVTFDVFRLSFRVISIKNIIIYYYWWLNFIIEQLLSLLLLCYKLQCIITVSYVYALLCYVLFSMYTIGAVECMYIRVEGIYILLPWYNQHAPQREYYYIYYVFLACATTVYTYKNITIIILLLRATTKI